MNLLLAITFQSGEFYYEGSSAPSYIPIIISAIAACIALFGLRFQMFSLIKNQLAEKARECNKNIDPETQAIIGKHQNISLVVSSIITGKLLIDKTFFIFPYEKQSLIDQFYLQLHTSIIEYIKANTVTTAFGEGIVYYTLVAQLDYCHVMFSNSIKKFGNALPKEIEDKLKRNR